MKIQSSSDLYRLAQAPSSDAPTAGPDQPAAQMLDGHTPMDSVVSASAALNRGLEAFPKFVYPTILNATADEQSRINRVLDTLPLKDVNTIQSITMVPELPSPRKGWVTQGMAWNYGLTNTMELARNDLKDPARFDEVLIHETGHTKDYETGIFGTLGNESSKAPFGQGERVTEYAKTNNKEDYAETYAKYHVDPERTKEVVPEKYEAIRKAEQQNFMERLVDREEFRETGRFIGEQVASSRASRSGLEVVASLSGGVQAAVGLEQLRKAAAYGDPEQHYQGILNVAAGTLFATGQPLPGMAVHSAQRALNRAVSRGEITAIDADAGVRTLSDPVERAVRAVGSKAGLVEPFRPLAGRYPEASPQRGLALGVAAGGAVGGLTGSLVGPYGGVIAGYHLGGPMGGAVGLVVGALGGYALGTELGGRAGGALARALGA